MKRRIMMLMMVAALAVAGFAGCGKKADEPTNTPAVDQKQDNADDAKADSDADADNADDADDTAPADTTAADTETEAEAEAPANDKPSMADWYAANDAEFRAIEESVNAEDMGCTLELSVVDGNVLVFCYTLDEAFPTDEESVATLGETYDSMFASYDSTFSELCGQVTAETSEETVTIRLVAANPDGTELYSRDYTE